MKQNYCQVGTPVQFFQAVPNKEWLLWPAVIFVVCGARVDILVLSEHPFIKRNINHATFKKDGLDFWQYIPEDNPPKCENMRQVPQYNYN